MKRNLLFIIAAILVAAILFFPKQIYWLFFPHTKQDMIEQVFRDREIYYVICFPQQVIAQRLHSKGSDAQKMSGYTKDEPIILTPDEVDALKTPLRVQSSYRWRINTSSPDYDVLFTFRCDGRNIRVALSFKNNMLGVFDGEDDNAQQVNTEYLFDPMRDQLIAVAKKIFPDDKDIQALQ
jgi:hypothetical protein